MSYPGICNAANKNIDFEFLLIYYLRYSLTYKETLRYNGGRERTEVFSHPRSFDNIPRH